MFALTCPHCKTELKTKFARPGATVKCSQCQQTYLLDARNTREVPDPIPAGVTAPAQPGQAGARSESKMAMAAMREMAEEMGELVPEVDIYAPSDSEKSSKTVKLILAICLLVVVSVGALYLIATTPIRDLFGSTPAKQPAPKKTTPAFEPGARPASDF